MDDIERKKGPTLSAPLVISGDVPIRPLQVGLGRHKGFGSSATLRGCLENVNSLIVL